MLNKLQPYFFKYYYVLSFIILILSNLFIFDNQPFSDDFTFIFGPTEIKYPQNPLYFLYPWSDYFKSWGLSYSLLWVFYKIFGEEYFYYRLVNLVIHFLNFLLFRKILEIKSNQSNLRKNLISWLFLLGPLSVLTTSWIFQIKTLLALFFTLSFLLVLYKKGLKKPLNFISLYGLFLLSLLSKISAILLPLYVFFYNKKEKVSLRKNLLLTIPLLSMSLVYGLINIKGITHLISEIKYLQKSPSQTAIKITETRSDVLKIKRKDVQGSQKKINPEINIMNEVSEGGKLYFSDFLNLNDFSSKYILSLQNFGKQILFSIGLNNYYPFYENNLETIINPFLYISCLIGLFFLFLGFYRDSNITLLTITLFLPISGFFYVPYMKFSYASDHWFYTASFAVILYIGIHLKNKKVLGLIFLTTFTSYFITITKYSSYEKLLEQNAKSIKNRFIYENQLLYSSSTSKKKESLDSLVEYFKNEQRYNFQYANLIYEVANKSQDAKTIQKVLNKSAKIHLRTKDINLTNVFLLKHHKYVSKDELNYLESLTTIFSHYIDKELYLKVESRLRN